MSTLTSNTDFSLTAGTVHTCAHLAREDDTVMVEDMGYMVVPFMVVLLLVVVGAHLAITSASKRAAARRAAVLRSGLIMLKLPWKPAAYVFIWTGSLC